MAGLIPVGCLVLGLRLPVAELYLIPTFISVCLLVLAGLLWQLYRSRSTAYAPGVVSVG